MIDEKVILGALDYMEQEAVDLLEKETVLGTGMLRKHLKEAKFRALAITLREERVNVGIGD